MRTQRLRSERGEPAMDYRSPTIHSLILTLAGAPFPHSLAIGTYFITGVKHGYDNARYGNRRTGFAVRRTTHQIVRQAKITNTGQDATVVVFTTDKKMAVVKAILVSAILYAMTAAFFS